VVEKVVWRKKHLEHSASGSPLAEFDLQYDGKALENALVIAIELRNLGADIKPDDFEQKEPIRFVYGKKASVKCVGDVALRYGDYEFPQELVKHRCRFVSGKDDVELHPMILNKNESVSFAALVENAEGQPQMWPPITGLPRIPQARVVSPNQRTAFYFGTLAAGALVAVVVQRGIFGSVMIGCLAGGLSVLAHYFWRVRLGF